MRPVLTLGLCASALTLAACQGEAEDAPDITEAIPLEELSEDTDSGESGEAQVVPSISDGETSRPEGAVPATPALPDTMESGSNPPGMTEPPPGSKVQRIGN